MLLARLASPPGPLGVIYLPLCCVEVSSALQWFSISALAGRASFHPAALQARGRPAPWETLLLPKVLLSKWTHVCALQLSGDVWVLYPLVLCAFRRCLFPSATTGSSSLISETLMAASSRAHPRSCSSCHAWSSVGAGLPVHSCEQNSIKGLFAELQRDQPAL